MIIKKDVLKVFIHEYEKKVEVLNLSLEANRKCARDAPGSNVSHSDTSKFQYSNLALGIEKRLTEANAILELLRNMSDNLTSNKKISGGSIVNLKNIDTEEIAVYLLIAREGGGDSVMVDGKKITAVYIRAPLGRVLCGKEKGDEIEFLKKTFEIIEVQ
jgi:transcription elongation GreA/GreB family factor